MNLRNWGSVFALLIPSIFSITANTNIIEPIGSNIVRVRTLNNLRKIQLTGFGVKFSPELRSSSEFALPSVLPTRKVYRIEFDGDEWVVKEGGVTYRVLGAQLKIDGNMVKINGEEFSDQVELSSEGRNFQVIARLTMDDYLKGVVPSEMPVHWPLEALKAQVVTARSYVMNMMILNRQRAYDVDDTTMHQVYRLKNFSSASLKNQEKILQAIRETSGVYLAYGPGDRTPYLSFYHSHCGGETEEPSDAWGVSKTYGTVKDEYCRMTQKSKWNYSISASELAKLIAKYLKVDAQIEFESVKVNSHTHSGRVHEINLSYELKSSGTKSAGGEKKSLLLTAEGLRKLIGYNKIKSAYFQMTQAGTGLNFSGRGLGHGVGMCQNGARFMALKGSSYTQILKRYYTHAHIDKSTYLSLRK